MITDEQIHDLRGEALAAGDEAMAKICLGALRAHLVPEGKTQDECRAECVRVIAKAAGENGCGL